LEVGESKSAKEFCGDGRVVVNYDQGFEVWVCTRYGEIDRGDACRKSFAYIIISSCIAGAVKTGF
jgi:hypothetical protein